VERSFSGDAAGSGAVIAWMIGAMVFSATFFYVSDVVTEQPRNLEQFEASTLSVGARSLADVLLDPGAGWTDPARCTSLDNQTLTTFDSGDARLGLGAEPCTTDPVDTVGNLSFEKLENLYEGADASDPENGLVDYEEARDSLDLTDEDLEFHLRTWPILPSAEEILKPGGREAPVHTLYIADYATATDDDAKASKKSGVAAPSDLAVEEICLIAALSRQFEPKTPADGYGTAAVPAGKGDVLPDDTIQLRTHLLDRLLDKDGQSDLKDITTLVIGSGADPLALDDAQIRQILGTWIQGGGTLIVLGTPTIEPAWLQPIIDQGQDTASGEVRNPDPGHPALHSPNKLDYLGYQSPASPVSYSSPARELFIHVAVSDFGDLLAVSNPGSFGQGRIALSAWAPGQLIDDQAQRCPADLAQSNNCEPLFLVHNLLSLTLSELYQDYGPPVPEDAPAADQLRLAYTYHPDLHESIPLSIELFVFPSDT
jgi:hypothetical protein